MSLELRVLHALLQSSRAPRARARSTNASLLARLPRRAGSAIRSLLRQGLVHLTPDGLRLTLAGFAVAVATSERRARRQRERPRAKILPMTLERKRRHAA